jgi:hypothetical protein
MRHLLSNLDYPEADYGVSIKPDPLIVGPADTFYETLDDYDPSMQIRV